MNRKHPIFLKTGFTTGACACAATIAALESLLKEQNVETVNIELPNGEKYFFDCQVKERTQNLATVSVIKNSGDDIDVTDGVEIFSTVKLNKSPGIKLIGGKGIGKCTKKGLAVDIGEAAINPVPRINICRNVKRILSENNKTNLGVSITLSIPNGKELASKTLNSSLGIKDGLSILGTTGIVKPMSNEAIIKTIYYELKQVLSQNIERAVVLVPGNYGQNFAVSLGINPNLIVQMSNFIGDSLDIAQELGFENILIIGDLGKLIKVAGGIFQTHSKVANLAAMGASTTLINKVMESKTTTQVIELIKNSGFEDIYEIIANKVKDRVLKRVGLNVDVVLFSNKTGLLSKTINEDNLIQFKE